MFIFCVLLSVFEAYCATVAFLKGTSCAGKTSICNALIEFDSSWKSIDEDIFFYDLSKLQCKKSFPAEYSIIEHAISEENIFHAIIRNQTLFKDSISLEEKKRAYQAISTLQEGMRKQIVANPQIQEEFKKTLTMNILSSIETHLKNGFNVIVDTWFLSAEDHKVFDQKYHVLHILAYCPLYEMIKRVIKRNKDAISNKNMLSMRFFRYALLSFFSNYDLIVENASNVQIIDSLMKSKIVNIFDLIKEHMIAGVDTGGVVDLFTRKEFSYNQLQQYQEKLIEKFASAAYVNIVAKIPYDLLLNTEKITPQESAQKILNYV